MKTKDLPIRPDDNGGNEVIDNYIRERKAIQTTDDLKAFVSRWKTLWEPDTFQNIIYSQQEQSLFDGTFDAEQTLKCLKECTNSEGCEHSKSAATCTGVYIALPVVLLQIDIMAERYGVPTDIALIQMFGGLGALYGDGT